MGAYCLCVLRQLKKYTIRVEKITEYFMARCVGYRGCRNRDDGADSSTAGVLETFCHLGYSAHPEGGLPQVDGMLS